MDLDQHAKSIKTLKDNQRWLNEHEPQIEASTASNARSAAVSLPQPTVRRLSWKQDVSAEEPDVFHYNWLHALV
jgi:hypothetical protein